MTTLTTVFACLMLATLMMFGVGAKGIILSFARPRGGKVRKGASTMFGIITMLVGFFASMVCFSIVIPSFGDAATVISTLAFCLVSAAVQVKVGLRKKPEVADAATATADANDAAMAAVTRVEPSMTPTQEVAAKTESNVSAVVPAAVATAAAVSSTVAPAAIAANDDASDELDAWAESQEDIPEVAPSAELTKVAAAPAVTPPTVSAQPAELPEVVAPAAAAVAAVAPAAQLDLLDVADVSEHHEGFDPANRHFQSAQDAAYEELVASMYPTPGAAHVA